MKISTRGRDLACSLAATVIAIGGLAGLAASSASAADLPIKSAPVRAVGYNWSGFYFGLHGGWAWSSSSYDDPLFRPAEPDVLLNGDGAIAGGQLGVNWQHGKVVVGLELDGSWASVRARYPGLSNPVPFPTEWSQGVHIDALATGTARLGYAMGNWLAYAKGGGAYAHMTVTTSVTAQGPIDTSKGHFGATAGAGIEVAFLRNVSGKIEYNFLYFPETKTTFSHPLFTGGFDTYVHLLKAGINVRFGGDPVVARY